MNAHIKNKIPIHLRILEKSKPLEDYCTSCGKCCKGKVELKKGVTIMLDHLGCKFLGGDNRCTVYPERFKKAPWCLDTADMIAKGAAAHDCPYIVDLKDYIAPIELSKSDFKKIKPLIKAVLNNSDTVHYDKKQLKDFLSE